MVEVKEFLEIINKGIKPGDNQRHNLTLDEHGILTLTLMLGDRYQPIALSENDLFMTFSELIQDIICTLQKVGVIWNYG